MKKQQLLQTLMAGAMVLGTAMPVCAVVDEEQNVNETEAAGGTDRETEVLYSQASTFTVTIPKKITLASSKDAVYSVNVKGDISSDKQVEVTPQDAIDTEAGVNFLMKDQAAVGTLKDDVVATVTQNKTVFSSAEVCVEDGGVVVGTTIDDAGISAQGYISWSL